MKTNRDKLSIKIIKISGLAILILIGSIFVNSCSMIKDNMNLSQEKLIDNSFISQNDEYFLHFNQKDGYLRNEEDKTIISFDYEYESGIARCTYLETSQKNETIIEEEKNMNFIFVAEEIIYSQNHNLLFSKI